MAQRKRRYLLALVLLLVVGLAMMLGYASRKQGYHVDELYTYELTNYPGGFYALEEGYLDTWQEGSLFQSALSPGPLTTRFPGTTRKSTSTRRCTTARCTRRKASSPGWTCPGRGFCPTLSFC